MTTWIILVLTIIWIVAMIYVYILRGKPIDWVRVLVTQGNPDWRHLEEKASSWKSCAVHSYYTGAKFDDGEPVDKDVMILGLRFSAAIRERNAKLAIEILDEIHQKDRMRFIPGRVKEAKAA